MILKGVAHVFGDHMNTDNIIAGKYQALYSRLEDLDKMSEYIMADIRPGFYREIRPGDFIVGGINFGCGSSRESAPWVIKKAGISAVLAKGFARIFFRNAINIGLPVLQMDTSSILEGDQLSVDLTKGQAVICLAQIGERPFPFKRFRPSFKESSMQGGWKNILKPTAHLNHEWAWIAAFFSCHPNIRAQRRPLH